MNTKTIPFAAVAVAAFVIFSSSPERLSAQSEETVTAVVTSASGAERYLTAYDRDLGRAGLSPQQQVTVTIQFPQYLKGKLVTVAALDGGELRTVDSGPPELYVGEDGTAAFRFRGGVTPGLYRVLAQLEGIFYRLEFYVLDLAHTERNPPRVRIVN